jgi:hypothetical protein
MPTNIGNFTKREETSRRIMTLGLKLYTFAVAQW